MNGEKTTRSIRIDDELLYRGDLQARRLGTSFNAWVVDMIEREVGADRYYASALREADRLMDGIEDAVNRKYGAHADIPDRENALLLEVARIRRALRGCPQWEDDGFDEIEATTVEVDHE